MRRIFSVGLVIALAACGSSKGNSDGDGDGGNGMPDACVGLECQIVNCAKMGQQPTTLTGTVFAPNGTLPLYGITVYVPLTDPPVPGDTLTCDQCSTNLPGGAVAQAISGEDGKFRLENVPVGDNIPLVITSGKWQRKITIPRVEQCVDSPLAATETSLPKNKAEGNIPKIAITTGDADALECLIRKLGLEAEMSTSAGTGRLHLYSGDGVNKVGATTMATATGALWNDVNSLKNYDIVILSCEGGQLQTAKTQGMLDNMEMYANAGGRVFASHWHNIWIGGNFQNQTPTNVTLKNNWASTDSTNPGTGISTWDRNDGNPGDPLVIDENSNPKGSAFANWMMAVGGSGPTTTPATMRGQITTQAGGRKMTARTLDLVKAERWVYASATNAPQNFQFTTPNNLPLDQRCGKVVFSDMHVSADSTSPNNGTFPNSCSSNALTPQEKALAFMFFDIASCVGQIF